MGQPSLDPRVSMCLPDEQWSHDWKEQGRANLSSSCWRSSARWRKSGMASAPGRGA
jgi:hypothetical protein